jgi:hypothetical protein
VAGSMPVDNQASSTRPIDIKHALFAIGPTATKYVINYLTLTNTHGRRQVDSINAWLNPATCKNKNNITTATTNKATQSHADPRNAIPTVAGRLTASAKHGIQIRPLAKHGQAFTS